MELYSYVLLFFLCSELGWMMEVVCKLIQFHRFINRGFLIGPYCPIYGFGAVLVTRMLEGLEPWPVAVFCLAVVICGTLEYLTSWAMEKLFHARWWDYSQKRFNLNGRICADTLLPFGLMGLVKVYFVKPLFFGWFALLPLHTLQILCGCLVALLLSDAVLSTHVLGKIRKTANLTQKDDTEALTAGVRAALGQRSALARRALRAFPYAKLYNNLILAKARERRNQLRAELTLKRAEVRAEIKKNEQALKAALQKKP